MYERLGMVVLVLTSIMLAGCTEEETRPEPDLEPPYLDAELRYNKLGGRDQVIDEGPAANIEVAVFRQNELAWINESVSDDRNRYDGKVEEDEFESTARRLLTSGPDGFFVTPLPESGPAVVCIDRPPTCFSMPADSGFQETFVNDARQGWKVKTSQVITEWGRLKLE